MNNMIKYTTRSIFIVGLTSSYIHLDKKDNIVVQLSSISYCDKKKNNNNNNNNNNNIIEKARLNVDHRNSSSTLSGNICAATYPANDPTEDRRYISDPNDNDIEVGDIDMDRVPNDDYNNPNGWSIGAVFDGHGGYNVSEYASIHLIPTLIRNITTLEKELKKNLLSINESDVDDVIIAAYDKIEKDYLDIIRPSYKLGFGSVASVGACSLIAFRKNEQLIIVNCGDCRAVLGSYITNNDNKLIKDKNNKNNLVVTTKLSRDHNARILIEQQNLRWRHPDELDEILFRCKNSHACYVKGRLQLTRSIGDAYLKYAEFNAVAGQHRSMGRHISDPFSPPYVSHIPEIHHIKINSNDKFVILGTDGLWDFMSDKEAIDIVTECYNNGKSKLDAANLLIKEVLNRAAIEQNMSVEDLCKIKVGKNRRNKHDDTTIVVMYL